jgi:tripartite-type tricarboxylate transporter receptor subunit TctC
MPNSSSLKGDKTMSSNRRAFLGTVAAAAIAPHLAHAQGQPVRLVVPFSAGSGTDAQARALADAITRTSARSVIVDNKVGAGSVLGSMDVMRARPDGNTLLSTTGAHTTNAVLIKSLPFDPIADFTPITRIVLASGFALMVSEKSPYKSLEQFLTAAKAQPGRLSYASAGVGNPTHVMGALFCKGVGVDMLHVPFKGTPTLELISGTVDSAFIAPSIAGPQIRAGQLRALAISGQTRSTLLPDVPSFAELGLKVQDVAAWWGIFGPAKMSPDAVRSAYETIAKAVQFPSFKAFMHDNGLESEVPMPPDQFKAYVTSEIERYRKVLPPLGIQLS